MNFLLDTNVISEWIKPRPDSRVVAWFANVDEDRVFLSVATIAELRHGVERLTPGARRQRLSAWLEHDLPERFEGRLLPIDAAVAHAWGRIVARGQAEGRSIDTMDAFIGAVAEQHGLALVTRDTAHSSILRQPLVNPWTDEA